MKETSLANNENIANIQDLNCLINKGFDAKHAGEFLSAIRHFSQAIELEPKLDLKLMLVLDIALMYQQFGNYKDAILILESFIDKHNSLLTFAATQELKTQLQYINYLQDMLEKIKMPNLPLSKIPMIVKVSVNEKIKDWKKSINF